MLLKTHDSPERVLDGAINGQRTINDAVEDIIGKSPPQLSHVSEGFSYDQYGRRYATLYSWSSLYRVPHTSLLRSLKGKKITTFCGWDVSNRYTDQLYCENDIETTCVALFHQAKLPILDNQQMCTIDRSEFITCQGFVKQHPKITWARAGRAALAIEKNGGMKLAKFCPSSGVPQFLKVYRKSALQHKLPVNSDVYPIVTALTGEPGERWGTIPLWAEYLFVSTEGLRLQLKDISPAAKVLVGNNRIQNAFDEADILDVVQAVTSESKGNIIINSLEDWRALPSAGETNNTGELIPENLKEISPDLVDTTASWAYDFSTTSGAIEQLIKRRDLHQQSVFGRSGIRIVRLYTRELISSILATKKPWGTNRKKRSRRK